MGDDWDAYRGAFAWLRDFANLKNTERGRVTKVSLAHRAQKGSRDRLARKASRAIKARLARPVRTVKKAIRERQARRANKAQAAALLYTS